MSRILPLKLVAGDTGSYPVLITGGPVTKAIFSLKVDLADDYSFIHQNDTYRIIKSGTTVVYSLNEDNDFGIKIDGDEELSKSIYINIIQEDEDAPESDSHEFTFELPSKLTEFFKSGTYSYDISIKVNNDNTDCYTPIYSYSYVIVPKINKII